MVSKFDFFNCFFLLKHFFQKDYKNHYCIRDCNMSKPMNCEYDFIIEWYSVLSRNCFNCTDNPEDCFKPNCVSANGFERPIKTVNRILPGPSIQVCLGDSILVNVENQLHSFEATSIHWHGLKQKGFLILFFYLLYSRQSLLKSRSR